MSGYSVSRPFPRLPRVIGIIFPTEFSPYTLPSPCNEKFRHWYRHPRDGIHWHWASIIELFGFWWYSPPPRPLNISSLWRQVDRTGCRAIFLLSVNCTSHQRWAAADCRPQRRKGGVEAPWLVAVGIQPFGQSIVLETPGQWLFVLAKWFVMLDH